MVENRESEVLKAMTLDYTFERREELTRRDALAEGMALGKAEGKAECILDILDSRGPIPPEMSEKIRNANIDTLTKWLIVAANSTSVDDFARRIETNCNNRD